MGADLCVIVIPFPLDWVEESFSKISVETAERILDEVFCIEKEDYDAWDECETARDVLAVKVNEALDYFAPADWSPRDVCIYSIIRKDADNDGVLIAGGTSWGDVTEGFDHAHLLRQLYWWGDS